MSRTIRRKNSWDAHFYIDDRVNDPKELDYLRGIHNYYPGCVPPGVGKYTGCTAEQIHGKLYNKYHSDCWYPTKPPGWSKGLRESLRTRNKQEIIRAIQNGTEDELHLTSRAEIRRCLYMD